MFGITVLVLVYSMQTVALVLELNTMGRQRV